MHHIVPDLSPQVSCEDQAEVDHVRVVPLERQVWGDESGVCTDRYAVRWTADVSQATS